MVPFVKSIAAQATAALNLAAEELRTSGDAWQAGLDETLRPMREMERRCRAVADSARTPAGLGAALQLLGAFVPSGGPDLQAAGLNLQQAGKLATSYDMLADRIHGLVSDLEQTATEQRDSVVKVVSSLHDFFVAVTPSIKEG